MPLIRVRGGALVLDGVPRQVWIRRAVGSWRLHAVWPSRAERTQLLREIRAGSPTLVIQNSVGEFIDVFDEELGKSRDLAAYVTERDQGTTTLFIPALDWLPRTTSRAARTLLGELMARPKEAGTAVGGLLTPPLGRHRNLRVMHGMRIPTGVVDAEWATHLIDRAFPPRPEEKRTFCMN